LNRKIQTMKKFMALFLAAYETPHSSSARIPRDRHLEIDPRKLFAPIPGWLSLIVCAGSFCRLCNLMTWAGVVLLASQSRAQESVYVVAFAVGNNNAFYRVAERVAAHRRGKIVAVGCENL